MELNPALQAFALYAGLLGLLGLFLAGRVGQLRVATKTFFGDGEEGGPLHRACRVHANFVEYVPLALIILLALALLGASAVWIHSLGATLFIARVLHAWGLSGGPGASAGRGLGALGSFLPILIGAGYLIYLAFAGG